MLEGEEGGTVRWSVLIKVRVLEKVNLESKHQGLIPIFCHMDMGVIVYAGVHPLSCLHFLMR